MPLELECGDEQEWTCKK